MNTSRDTPLADHSQVKTARALSYQVLCQALRSSQFATRLLDDAFGQTALSADDRRLATELTYGVVRREVTLDAIISVFVSRGRDSVEPELWRLLQLGVYQLVFTTGIPTHAAVHETVDLAKSAGKQRWTGFANGVLRSIARSLSEEQFTQPAARAVPLRDGNYRGFDRGIFPDPADRPGEYFAAAFGFGDWVSQRWLDRFGFEELLRLGFWWNAPAMPYLRTNLLKVERDVLLRELQAADVPATAGSLPESIRLAGFVRVETLPGFHQGWFSVQDESAMAAARLLNPSPGTRVWDMCAAPGGKTTHLAEIMQNRGEILASDIDAQRLTKVVQTRERLGLDIITTEVIDSEGGELPTGVFDAIMIDAPCSNTGVLGKRPEARQRVTPENLAQLQALQIRLLRGGLERLGPQGRLVYSTCSIEPEENWEVVSQALSAQTGIELREDGEHIPGRPADGGYQALLVRR